MCQWNEFYSVCKTCVLVKKIWQFSSDLLKCSRAQLWFYKCANRGNSRIIIFEELELSQLKNRCESLEHFELFTIYVCYYFLIGTGFKFANVLLSCLHKKQTHCKRQGSTTNDLENYKHLSNFPDLQAWIEQGINWIKEISQQNISFYNPKTA